MQPSPQQLYPEQQFPQPAPNAQNAAPVQQQQQQYPQQQQQQQQYPQQQQQHQVIVQTAPTSGRRRYENYKAEMSFGLGLTQILIGVLCIIFNIVGICISVKDEYGYQFVFYIGYGIWNAFFFIIAGGFGVGARSKNPCPIIAFMVMSIIAAVMTIFVIGFASGGITEVNNPYNNEYRSGDSYYSGSYWYTGGNKDMKGGKLAMHALMLILAFVELVVAIWSSAICCHAACCCRDHTGTVHATPFVQYSQGLHGQQQVVYIQTSGMPQQYFIQGQQPQQGGAFAYTGIQQGGAFAYTGMQQGGAYPAQGMAQPPAYTTTPPAYGPASSSASAPTPIGQPPHGEQSKNGMPPAAY